MSKNKKQTNTNQQSAPEDISVVDQDNSPGKQLTKAREALGFTQQQVADRLHLRISSVQAVEQDALEDDISVTFNKGYVRLYARLVQLEIDPLLAAYDRLHNQDNHTAKLQSFSRRVSREADDQRWNMVTIVVVLLVLGSVIGWWVQQSDSLEASQGFVAETFDGLFNESESDVNATQTEPSEQKVVVKLTSDDDDVLHLKTGPEISEETVAELDKTAIALTQDIGEEEVSNVKTQAFQGIDDEIETLNTKVTEVADVKLNASNKNIVVQTSEASSTVNTKATPIKNTANRLGINDDGTVDMAFTFNDDCWVSIKDVNGEVIAIGVKVKGRVMKVSGLPPIQVILGVPQNVEIDFAGKSVDMSQYPNNQTANFTLKIENV